MEGLSPVELLQPETQTLIMSHISCATSLHALLRASPRFYQVFRSRREYHLTCLAVQQSSAAADSWDTVKASKLPKPPSRDATEAFTQDFQDDYGYKALILPTDKTIPMIRLNACVEWFIADFAQSSLPNLSRLGKFLDLQQDRDVTEARLSSIEKSRIARAFCRFETFRHLFPPAYEEWSDINKLQPGVNFLNKYNYDEIEEIACVRDYIIRQLWTVFDDIEDDFVQGQPAEPIQKAAQGLDDRIENKDWFDRFGKNCHSSYMEYIMSLGLELLREIFTADRKRCAELVFANSTETGGFLTDTLSLMYNDEPFDPRPSPVHFLSSYHDSLIEASIGWHWVMLGGRVAPGTQARKGLRDCGYVFWDKERIKASGFLNELYG